MTIKRLPAQTRHEQGMGKNNTVRAINCKHAHQWPPGNDSGQSLNIYHSVPPEILYIPAVSSVHNYDDVLIWIDIETTGLDARLEGAGILEIHVQATDKDFNLLDEGAGTVIKYDRPLTFEVEALIMHAKSGLLQTLEHSIFYLEDAVSMVERYIHNWWGTYRGQIYGSSAHFDIDWLKIHMPKVKALFNHRIYDSSGAMSREAEMLGCPVPKNPSAHRAKDDVLASIDLARRVRTAIKELYTT